MKETVNFHLATLIIVIAGVGAALLVVHIAYSNTLPSTFVGSETEYDALEQSILNQ